METNLIIDFTPTGMIPDKKMTPRVPVSVSEIIEDVHSAWEESGVTSVQMDHAGLMQQRTNVESVVSPRTEWQCG